MAPAALLPILALGAFAPAVVPARQLGDMDGFSQIATSTAASHGTRTASTAAPPPGSSAGCVVGGRLSASSPASSR